MIKPTFVLVFIYLFLHISKSYCFDDNEANSEKDLSRGFGSGIKWIQFDEALARNKEERIPILLLIHKTWCGACQNLKPKLSDSLKFKELSEHFLMVNLENDEEPSDSTYAPDGNYIPRLMFVDKDGEIRKDLINENGNPKYKYFYASSESVITSMEKSIQILTQEADRSENETNIKNEL